MGSHHGGLARARATAERLAHRRHKGDAYTAREHIAASPSRVLEVLSDPEAVRRWFPVQCEFEEEVDRLRAGSSYRTTGRLAGRHIHADLRVLEADERRVAVSLVGHVIFDLDVELSSHGAGTCADIRVSVHPGGGLSGRLLTPAAAAMLRAGALGHTVAAIRGEAEAG
jgi:carbon monoxide dehydrogenase subunit G